MDSRKLSGPGAVRIPAAPLFGREGELREIAAVLAGGVRIVTLVGPPGVGKSRLALHAVGDLPVIGAGATAFVALAPVATTDLVLPTIGQALGVPDGDEPLPARITRAIDTSGTTLLVLDNLEHLSGVGAVVSALVDACPGMQVLATSRERLRVGGEHAVEVRPLALPGPADGPEALAANPAVTLFVARAGSGSAAVSRRDLPAVAAICARVDGLPLAIELAAARVPLLGTARLLATLEESTASLATVPPVGGDARHTSLDAVVDWSYRLLAPDERALLRRLSVFVGGFGRDGVEAMVRGRPEGAGYPFADQHRGVGFETEPWTVHPALSPAEPVDGALREALPALALGAETGLTRLLEASLLGAGVGSDGEPRYELLETIRDFGLRRLAEAGDEDAVRHAVAAEILGFLDAAVTEVWSTRTQTGLSRRIPDELGNVRAALAWVTSDVRPRPELAARMAAQLWFPLQVQGRLPEARRWLETALALPGAPAMARGFALNSIAFVAWAQGDDAAAEAACTEAIDELPGLVPGAPPSSQVANAHFVRALVAWRRGQVGPMLGDLQAAVEHFRVDNDRGGLGNCALAFGVLARVKRDTDEARRQFDDALRLHGEIGYAWGMATSRYYAGEAAHDMGQTVEAARLIGEGLDRYWGIGDRWGAGACVAGLAVLAAERGEPRRAARLFGGGFAMSEGIGAVLPPVDLERYRRVAEEVVRPQTGDGPFDEGRRATAEETVAAARRLAEEIVAGVVPGVRNRLKELLTPDQYPVVELWVQGKSVDEIMGTLFKGKTTVYDHLKGARDRLGVRTNRELTVIGSELLRQVD